MHKSFYFALVMALTVVFSACGKKQQQGQEQPVLEQEPVICIDAELQKIIEEEVSARMELNGADFSCALLINKEGQVVAQYESQPEGLKATDELEFGSLVFPFSILSAHRHDAFIDSTTVVSVTKQGFWTSGIHIKDGHPMDADLRVRDILAVSSNSGVCQLVQDCEDFDQTMKELGFKTGTPLANTYHRAIGYDIYTTPLHITWLYHCLANGLFPEEWQVASSGVLEGLHDCVWKDGFGTASIGPWGDKRAQSELAPMMGKTGTAQLNRSDREHRIAFVGIFPEEDPQYTCLVIFDHPHNFPGYSAGHDCGNTVRQIAERIVGTTN